MRSDGFPEYMTDQQVAEKLFSNVAHSPPASIEEAEEWLARLNDLLRAATSVPPEPIDSEK